MPIKTQIWTVGAQPKPLEGAQLASEQLLEDMIVTAPALLSEDWMLIGRQENTGHGGRIDLLALAPDASLILIELKRDRTPREVVAQALDYAVWVERLEAEDIAAIYKRFRPAGDLAVDFFVRFGVPLESDSLNQSHQIVIVAAELDTSSERIVAYLSERDIAINVLCFQVFQCGEQQLISRAWLLDPAETPQTSVVGKPGTPSEPWNGEHYCSFGDSRNRSWQEAVQFGFISGGGGAWYSNSLRMLAPGDRVWVNIPQQGYVGVGLVTGVATPAADFQVIHDGRDTPVLEVVTQAHYHRDVVNDLERCEYFVPVNWIHTVPQNEAVKEVGLFGNQNTVCRPTTPKWRWTIERLKERFRVT
ncbi:MULTISPECIES: endonuclease NucS domain-containing protein [unclassified Pseudomonas]|uniref:endonuclease NucS domain-containing protein n=1 Tax=unclassified Pseudomonas TaxID=196821 RepID=UPI000DA8B89F|nr:MULTISPECIES: endonuclease NucS domain-containing protein [unclassified Pseudomonas]MDW3716626.1 endonuclease NucS [Pseudomonas sp. 2023EL-01195]PZE12195.1 nuclease [Pseudomonas sp. 57B-090624]